MDAQMFQIDPKGAPADAVGGIWLWMNDSHDYFHVPGDDGTATENVPTLRDAGAALLGQISWQLHQQLIAISKNGGTGGGSNLPVDLDALAAKVAPLVVIPAGLTVDQLNTALDAKVPTAAANAKAVLDAESQRLQS